MPVSVFILGHAAGGCVHGHSGTEMSTDSGWRKGCLVSTRPGSPVPVRRPRVVVRSSRAVRRLTVRARVHLRHSHHTCTDHAVIARRPPSATKVEFGRSRHSNFKQPPNLATMSLFSIPIDCRFRISWTWRLETRAIWSLIADLGWVQEGSVGVSRLA